MKLISSDRASIQTFLGAMMHWCFQSGVEVTLRNKAWNTPPIDPVNDKFAVGEFHERDRDGSLVDMVHNTKYKVIEIPDLVFTRGNRHVSIVGYDWDDLMGAFEYRYKHIFTELSVPYFDWKRGQ